MRNIDIQKRNSFLRRRHEKYTTQKTYGRKYLNFLFPFLPLNKKTTYLLKGDYTLSVQF